MTAGTKNEVQFWLHNSDKASPQNPLHQPFMLPLTLFARKQDQNLLLFICIYSLIDKAKFRLQYERETHKDFHSWLRVLA